LRDGGVRIDELTGPRTGLVAGTTLGSFRSTSDYSRATLVQEKPYLVNPMLFPNTVMNCAAGQSAIRHGLRGVNATVAGGRLAFHQALRYARNALAAGYADTMLAGAVEEFSPHRAWSVRIQAGEDVPVGEGAAFFVLRRWAPDDPAPAQIAGIATGFSARGDADASLAGCVRRALSAAGRSDADVTLVAGADDDDCAAVGRVLSGTPERLSLQPLLGACDAASGALGLAALLPRLGAGTAILAARSDRGGAAAAVIVGGSR
jgi:3-oxoacyl-[acyl-carrier-protein] synthase II